ALAAGDGVAGIQVVAERALGQRRAGGPEVDVGIVFVDDVASSVAGVPVVAEGAVHIGHGSADDASALDLEGVAGAVVADGDAVDGDEAAVAGVEAVGVPAHGAAVLEEAQFGVVLEPEVAAAGFDGAGAVGDGLFAALPGAELAEGDLELKELGVDAAFASGEMVANEGGWRDVVELVGIDAGDPVAIAEE